jgi:hypothetical protein
MSSRRLLGKPKRHEKRQGLRCPAPGSHGKGSLNSLSSGPGPGGQAREAAAHKKSGRRYGNRVVALEIVVAAPLGWVEPGVAG